MAANESYNDGHRALLQAFMARSTMTYEQAKPVLAAIFTARDNQETLPEDITQADLSNYIATINTAISPFDLEIRSTRHQTDPTRIYVLVNTTSDPLTQLATTYNANEIAFVKRVLDAMFDTHNTPRLEAMAVSSMQVAQLAKAPSTSERRESAPANGTPAARAPQSLGIREADDVMKRLVEEGWFEESRRGYFTLSPRALTELRGWLVATYNEDEEDSGTEGSGRIAKIKTCLGCKDIITVGQRCSQRQCPGRLHDICTQNFFRRQQAETCPVCKSKWTGEHFVGERAIVAANRPSTARRRSGRPAEGAESFGGQDGGEDDGDDAGEMADVAG
ncbi:DNA repair protein Nse1 [Histoplasma capsulatum]|uniref:Non-structural maintenance of chromosomes element 1 homolog n=2 Tax=Histoplasma TaxID=5036 RepID=A0A8A1MQS2_AJECA|nr:DNA repair protein Nse1 [Histoplasma capsulatum]